MPSSPTPTPTPTTSPIPTIAPTPTATTSTALACALAKTKFDADDPKRAAEILKPFDTTLACPALAEALDAINGAESAPEPAPSKSAAELACALAQTKFDADDPKRAAEILKPFDTTTACPALAEAVDAAQAPEPSWLGKVGKAWDNFVEAYATPLANALLAALGIGLAIFVIARLFVEFRWAGASASTSRDRRNYGLLGWIVLGSVSAGTVVAGVLVKMDKLVGPAVIGVFGALLGLGLVAAISLALWLGTKLRMKLSMAGEKDVTSAQVAERLRALAGSGGGRIELPSSPQVAELGTSLTSLSAVKWIEQVQKVLLFLVGVVPWDAQVNVIDGRRASVTIVRNGRTITTREVSTKHPRLEPLDAPPTDVTDGDILAAFIAAQILMCLRERYSADFEPGLYGATKPESVALQHIAVRWYMRSPASPQAVKLLEVAVANDPLNQLAQVSLQSARYRHTDDPETLEEYGQWVVDALKQRMEASGGDGTDDLAQGLLITLTAIVRNLASGRKPPRPSDSRPADPSTGPALPEQVAKLERTSGRLADAWKVASAAADAAREALDRARTAAKAAAASKAAAERDAKAAGSAPTQAAADAAAHAARDALASAESARNHAVAARTDAEASMNSQLAGTAWWRASSAQQEGAETVAQADTAEGHAADALASARLARHFAGLSSGCLPDWVTSDTDPGLINRLEGQRDELETALKDNARDASDAAKDRARYVRTLIALAALRKIRDPGHNTSICKALDDPKNRIFLGSVPELAYSYACYLARWEGKPFSDPEVSRLFDTALTDDLLASFITDDPELYTAPDQQGLKDLRARAASRP